MTRREKPSRHGRAADALIASYVRELLADDPVGEAPDAASHAPAEPLAASFDGSPARASGADATL